MLRATRSLLAEGGLGAVTIAAVAREASSSNGSLYHRFGGRTGLLLAAQDQAFEEIESETVAAFARADREPDDDRALRLLVRAALDIFRRHRAEMRAFLVETKGRPEFEERVVHSSHLLATTVTEWVRDRYRTGRADAEATYRVLFALGASQALFDDHEISPGRLGRRALEDAVTRAVDAIIRG